MISKILFKMKIRFSFKAALKNELFYDKFVGEKIIIYY